MHMQYIARYGFSSTPDKKKTKVRYTHTVTWKSRNINSHLETTTTTKKSYAHTCTCNSNNSKQSKDYRSPLTRTTAKKVHRYMQQQGFSLHTSDEKSKKRYHIRLHATARIFVHTWRKKKKKRPAYSSTCNSKVTIPFSTCDSKVTTTFTPDEKLSAAAPIPGTASQGHAEQTGEGSAHLPPTRYRGSRG